MPFLDVGNLCVKNLFWAKSFVIATSDDMFVSCFPQSTTIASRRIGTQHHGTAHGALHGPTQQHGQKEDGCKLRIAGERHTGL